MLLSNVPRICFALALLACACRNRAFNEKSAAENAKGTQDKGTEGGGPTTWLACKSQDRTWTFTYGAQESRELTLTRDGQAVFRSEVRKQVDRSVPTARVFEAYGLQGVRSYRRIEITTARDDEDVYRGSTWDVSGPTRAFSCEGTFGFKVP